MKPSAGATLTASGGGVNDLRPALPKSGGGPMRKG